MASGLGGEKLIDGWGLINAKRILDYAHVDSGDFETDHQHSKKKAIFEALNLSKKEQCKLSVQVKELLWSGSIDGISTLVREKLLSHKGYGIEATLCKKAIIAIYGQALNRYRRDLIISYRSRTEYTQWRML